MKRVLRSIAIVSFFALSFGVLVEPYVCPEERGQGTGAPVECCVQCCPRHHLVPPAANLTQTLPETPWNEFLVTEFIPHSALPSHSIFHPPRA
jgi:hypothetical protein